MMDYEKFEDWGKLEGERITVEYDLLVECGDCGWCVKRCRRQGAEGASRHHLLHADCNGIVDISEADSDD
ncbi:hypothetical protein BRC81_00160 [Halobacteriales archaeon QS_1_68_20]|nr:MAG: hypothetical protein BRC81_00160 [Halobacteriales archaeon QS_1_68_20]